METAFSKNMMDNILWFVESDEAKLQLAEETETFIDWAAIAILKGGM